MEVDLDGLATNIKAAIAGDRAEEMRFMVDEIVRNLKDAERAVIAERERILTILSNRRVTISLYRELVELILAGDLPATDERNARNAADRVVFGVAHVGAHVGNEIRKEN